MLNLSLFHWCFNSRGFSNRGPKCTQGFFDDSICVCKDLTEFRLMFLEDLGGRDGTTYFQPAKHTYGC